MAAGSHRLSFLSLFAILFFLSACGRYLPPVPPEDLAPASVQESKSSTEGAPGTVTIRWNAPSVDRRGKKLTEILGYSVMRWIPESPLSLIDSIEQIPFQEVMFIKDTHLLELEKQIAEAEEKGQIVRKISVPDSLKTFSYTDTTIPEGTAYYKIVPVNYYGGQGAVTSLFKVTKRGGIVSVVTLPYSDPKKIS